MTKQRKYRQAEVAEPHRGGARSERWEEKRRRFADEDGGGGSRPLRPSFYITLGGILIVVLFVAMMTFRTSGGSSSGPTLQQVTAATAATENGRVSISVDEVASKKLVAWDYKKKDNTTIPLLAYTTPSGAVKVATRMCEPCNSTSFRVEGNQLVCNSCGSRWDLENSNGISGGCQTYPPEVLPSIVEGGKITVDEGKVSNWKPRAL